MTVPQQLAPTGPGALRRFAPPPALTGFVVLLAVMFAVAYAVGSVAGPVAPGLHRTEPGSGSSSGGTDDVHGSGGAHSMPLITARVVGVR